MEPLIRAPSIVSTFKLPIHHPQPVPANPCPVLTTQAFDAATSTESLALTEPKGKKQNTVGARIIALALFDAKFNKDFILEQTGVLTSSWYKLRKKTLECGWQSGRIVETWHVDDAARSGRPRKATTAVIDRIIEVVTKNSTTRSWSSAWIAQEVRATPGILEKEHPSASTVYRVLRSKGYCVCKRTANPGLTKKQKDARLA